MEKSAILEKIKPHLCLCEWGDADTEDILHDIMIAVENKLPAISVLPAVLPVMSSLADTNTRVLAFTDKPDMLPSLSEKKITAQLFVSKPNTGADTGAILSFTLKDISHLDLEQIISCGHSMRGFLFIDEKGRFLHKFYDFLNLAETSFAGELHYCAGTNDIEILENARRLVEKVRPDLLPNLHLFVTADFFKNLDNGRKSI